MTLNLRAAMLSMLFLIITFAVWEALNQPPEASEALSEFELLMGGADQEARVPRLLKSLATLSTN